jgi:hypothetical protein
LSPPGRQVSSFWDISLFSQSPPPPFKYLCERNPLGFFSESAPFLGRWNVIIYENDTTIGFMGFSGQILDQIGKIVEEGARSLFRRGSLNLCGL